MSYSSNPLLPKARKWATNLVLVDGLSSVAAARRAGVHRTTPVALAQALAGARPAWQRLNRTTKPKKITQLLTRWNRGDLAEADLLRYTTNFVQLIWLNGKPLTQHVLHKMIINPVYAGYVCDKFTGYKTVDGKHEGLINQAMYWQNQEVVKRKNKDYLIGLRHDSINAEYPLRQFIRCASCNGHMTACARPQTAPIFLSPP